MLHFQERIDDLFGAMSQRGFKVTNPSEQPLGKSKKKSVTVIADVLDGDTPLMLSVDYTNWISSQFGDGYETSSDPDISWVRLSKSLPGGDYTILPDSDLAVSLIRFKQSDEAKEKGFQRILGEFGEGKTIRWDEVTVRESGAYGVGMGLEYDFCIKPTRRCNFELDISPETKKAKKSGDLQYHNLQVKEDHFCIVGDEYPIFPFSLEQANVYSIRFDWLSFLDRERFNQLFAEIPLSLEFQVAYRNGIYIEAKNRALTLSCLGESESLEPTATTIRENMDLFGQFYQGFRSY